jgi:pimeloyl-ACP methyl ester carboxylesterase
MPNIRTQLMALQLPVHLIAGAYDVTYTAHARQMHKMIPNSALTVLSEAAHRVHLDTPIQISDIINKFILTHP